jgi:hypothetical protein
MHVPHDCGQPLVNPLNLCTINFKDRNESCRFLDVMSLLNDGKLAGPFVCIFLSRSERETLSLIKSTLISFETCHTKLIQSNMYQKNMSSEYAVPSLNCKPVHIFTGDPYLAPSFTGAHYNS